MRVTVKVMIYVMEMEEEIEVKKREIEVLSTKSVVKRDEIRVFIIVEL